MNVTEVGRKLAGTGAAIDDDEGRGTVADDSVRPVPVGVAVAGCPACAADVGFGFSTRRLTTWGTVTAAATITAAEVAVMASLRILRRRARRLIRSKVPGGGGSGLMRWLSQSSTSSRRSAISLLQRRLQLGARREQVGLDGALRPAQQRRYLADPEAAVVMQQERVTQPRRQRGDEVAHVDVLYRVGDRVRRRARGDAADGAPLPFGLAPVVADQVRGDHIKVALRAVHPGPPGQQPDEGLRCDLVRGFVVVDQPPDPAGQLGVDALEQLFGSVGVVPVNLTSGAHRIPLDEAPRRRRERRGLAPRATPARHEHHVGSGRGVLETTRVIRHFYHISWDLARARPVTSGSRCARRRTRPRALYRRRNPLIGCAENSFSPNGLWYPPGGGASGPGGLH